MSDELFQFRWYHDQDGYVLQEHPPSPPPLTAMSRTEPEWYIHRKGGPLRFYRPREEAPDIHRKFANLSPTPESILGFINEFGFLGSLHSSEDQTKEQFALTRDAINNVKTILSFLDTEGESSRVSKMYNEYVAPHMTVRIDDSNPNRKKTCIFPRTLISLIWLNVAEEICDGVKWKQCKQCPTWFVLGRKAGTRRKVFCSPKCRVAWNRKHKEIGNE